MTQAEKFSEELKRLSPDVTAEDRIEAVNLLDVSSATVVRYLNGEVRNNDLAASMITMFRRKISLRDKVLK